MIPSNLPQHPIPSDLKSTLYNPLTPWRVSPALFKRVSDQNVPLDISYRTCEVLYTDPEYQFILKYFMQSKPPNFGIKKIICIHNPSHTISFEAGVKNIDME